MSPPPSGPRRRAGHVTLASRSPRGSGLWALMGAFVGLWTAVLVQAIAWSSAHGHSVGRGLDHVIGRAFTAAFLPGTLAGLLVGFLAVGLLVRNNMTLLVLRGGLQVLAVVAAGVLGAALGALLWAGYAIATGASTTAAAQGVRAAFSGGSPAAAVMLAGFVAGVAVLLAAAGRRQLRTGARVATGACIGGLAGLFIFSVAYVLLGQGGIPRWSEALPLLVRAINSLAPAELLFVSLGAVFGAMLSRYAWRVYGILTFLSLVSVILGYLLYSLTVTLPSVPDRERPFSLILLAAEGLSLAMVLLYSFYTIDVAARKHWRRTTEEAPFSPYFLPKVVFQVPCFNEPPELVADTLRSLLRVDYPADRVHIMVCDDSTRPECSGPVAAFCAENGIEYHHRADRRGYKAGALNLLLKATPQDAALIAVVDADYQVEPEFLRETVGFFIDPEMGWLQTPQDYRNRHESFLTERYYLADAYFYRTILPSRNEENSIIFCGTMGILRKSAVEAAGGWSETCITEDAELSARLLNSGWRSLYVNKTYGRGLIPPTFEAYQKQQYRWAFGGGRIFRSHVLRFLFGRFTFRQRLDYLVGSFNWFEGAFIFGIACTVLFMGVADILGTDVVTHHNREILLIGLVPLVLLLDGLTRVHLVLRRSIQLRFFGTLSILGMWFSVKFSNMRAALKALVGVRIPFVRTPKRPTERMGRLAALRQAVRLTRFETGMAVLSIAVSLGVAAKLAVSSGEVRMARGFLAFWLFYYSLVFSAAPLYAYKSLASPAPRQAPSAPEPARLQRDDAIPVSP